MALRPEHFTQTNLLQPLPTGFQYRPRSEIEDFELDTERAARLTDQLVRIDQYHRRLYFMSQE